MNRKKMPIILMLVAGAVAWIITFVQHYMILDSMIAVLVAVVIFYSLGRTIRWMLDRFEDQNEKLRQEQEEANEGDAENIEGKQVAAEA